MKNKKLNSIVLCMFIISAATGTSQAGELFDKVYKNDIKAVKKLLAAGADINELSEIGGVGKATPLFIASSYYKDMAKLLISKGADVNIKNGKGETPLMAACYSSEEVARLLVAKGADINAKSNAGTGAFTCSIFAIFSGRMTTSLAEFLLSKGANVDETTDSDSGAGYTPLMYASVNKKPDLVKFLVKHGANVNAKTKDNSTPLSLAVKEKDTAMVKLLKSLGAKK